MEEAEEEVVVEAEEEDFHGAGHQEVDLHHLVDLLLLQKLIHSNQLLESLSILQKHHQVDGMHHAQEVIHL